MNIATGKPAAAVFSALVFLMCALAQSSANDKPADVPVTAGGGITDHGKPAAEPRVQVPDTVSRQVSEEAMRYYRIRADSAANAPEAGVPDLLSELDAEAADAVRDHIRKADDLDQAEIEKALGHVDSYKIRVLCAAGTLKKVIATAYDHRPSDKKATGEAQAILAGICLADVFLADPALMHSLRRQSVMLLAKAVNNGNVHALYRLGFLLSDSAEACWRRIGSNMIRVSAKFGDVFAASLVPCDCGRTCDCDERQEDSESDEDDS